MNLLVCGRIKEGKTVKAIELAWQRSDGVVVWCPRHMVRGVVLQADQDMSLADELEAAIEDHAYENGPLVLYPSGETLEEDFAEVCSVLFNPPERYACGGFAFVVDEAADLQKAQSINKSLRVAVKQHPRSVDVIQCTHSLQEFDRASKDTMAALYCFRLQGRSLTAAVEYADVEDDEDLREAIRTLGPHEYVKVDFEAQRGEPSWSVNKSLDKGVVEDITLGRKPDVTEDNNGGEGKQAGNRMDTGRGTANRNAVGSEPPPQA